MAENTVRARGITADGKVCKMTSLANKEEDTYLHFILSHGPSFFDFFGPTTFSKEAKIRHYQLEPMMSQDMLVEGGRSGGKSLSMEFIILITAVNDEEEGSQIVTAFRRAHVKDRMEGVIKKAQGDPLLSEFLKKVHGREPINRQPRYEIHFYKRGTVYGAAVGDDKDAVSLQGLHPRYRYVEESAYFPEYAFNKFQGTAAEIGTIDRNFGVRNGVRGTPWWDWDHNKAEFSRFKGSRFVYTRRWTPYYDEQQFLQDVAAYGGEDDSEFMNQVDGEWGTPARGEWNMRHVYECIRAGEVFEQLTIKSCDIEDGDDYDCAIYQWIAKHPEATEVRLGVDVQYAEPTCALVFQKIKKHWTLTSCLWLADKMSHSLQASCIESLALALGGVRDIAIDATGGDGRAVHDSLRESGDPSIWHLTSIDWKNTVLVEQRRQSDDIYEPLPEPIKMTVKDNAIRILREMFASKSIFLPDSEKLLSDLMSETRKRIARGWALVTPDKVHIPEAMRAFAHSLYLSEDEEFFGNLCTLAPQVTVTSMDSGLFGRKRNPDKAMIRKLFGS